MQRTRSGASGNVRFAREVGSRPTTVTSITEEQTENSRASSARTSSVTGAPAAGQPMYEIWEPPDETVLDHYKSLPGESKTSPGTRLGRIVAAAVHATYTGRPVSLRRFSMSRSSLSRTRSVVSESDVSSVSRDELIRDAQRLGLPIRNQTAPPVRVAPAVPRVAHPVPRVIPPAPRVIPPLPRAAPPLPRAAPPAPQAAPPAPRIVPTVSQPGPPVSRTLATALAPSTSNPQGMPVPISPSTYRVWRASIARPPNLRYATSPYTRIINDAIYKPKPIPPIGTIIESGGEGIIRAERALYAELSTRPVDERIYWTMPPDHDERVRNRFRAVDKMSRELALYGLDMYLAYGVKGAIMTNAGYHAPEWPESPAFDWITFDDARKSGDKTLQESIAFTDPSMTTLVFIFLVSRSGESLAIWRRKFTVPPSEQLRRDLELRRVALEAQRRGQIYEIDLNPPMISEDSWVLVTPTATKKKHRKFPWFKVDWGS